MASPSRPRCAAVERRLASVRPDGTAHRAVRQAVPATSRELFTVGDHGTSVVDGLELASICYDGCFPEHARCRTAACRLTSSRQPGGARTPRLYYAARRSERQYACLAGLTGRCGARVHRPLAVYDPEGLPLARLATAGRRSASRRPETVDAAPRRAAGPAPGLSSERSAANSSRDPGHRARPRSPAPAAAGHAAAPPARRPGRRRGVVGAGTALDAVTRGLPPGCWSSATSPRHQQPQQQADPRRAALPRDARLRPGPRGPGGARPAAHPAGPAPGPAGAVPLPADPPRLGAPLRRRGAGALRRAWRCSASTTWACRGTGTCSAPVGPDRPRLRHRRRSPARSGTTTARSTTPGWC